MQTAIQEPTQQDDLSQIIDLKTLLERYPQLSEPSMRWALAQRKNNGLLESGAAFKFGRRWMFDVPKFTQWMKNR